MGQNNPQTVPDTLAPHHVSTLLIWDSNLKTIQDNALDTNFLGLGSEDKVNVTVT